MKNKIIFTWTKNWLKNKKISCSVFNEVSGTNAMAKNQLDSLILSDKSCREHVFLAAKQSQGKGQRKNIWLDSDLMITWLWNADSKITTPDLCENLVLDLLESLSSVWPQLPYKIKKPNDLCLENKKIAGLLLEVIDISHKKIFIVGLGLNVFCHPKNINATDLQSYLPTKKDSSSASQIQKNSLQPIICEQKWSQFLNGLRAAWEKRL